MFYGNISLNETPPYEPYLSNNITSNTSYFKNLYNTCVGSTIFFTLLPFFIFKLRILPFATPYFALVGASFMIWTNVVTTEEFFNVMSTQEYISGILLLLGTTIIGDYYHREQCFSIAIRHLLREDQLFSNYLLRISCISFIISMLFSSDLSCMVLTPIIFKCWEEQERTENELETIVLSISTSSILGGSALPFGNVALSLLAAGNLSSDINMKTCLKYFLVPSFICFWLNYAFLLGLYHLKHKRCCDYFHRPRFCRKKVLSHSKDIGSENYSISESALNDLAQHSMHSNVNGLASKDDRHFHPPALETIIEDEVLVLPETPTLMRPDSRNTESALLAMKSSLATEDLTMLDEEMLTSSLSSGLANSQLSNARSSEAHLIGYHGQRPSMILNWEAGQSVVGFTMVHLLNPNQGFHEVQGSHNTGQKFMRTILILVELVVLVLHFISSFEIVQFDTGLISTSGAMVVIITDAFLFRRSLSSSHSSSASYKWGLPFVGFPSLLILMYGFCKTGLPYLLLSQSFKSSLFLFIVALILVNLIGIAPVFLMFTFLLSNSSFLLISSSSSSSPVFVNSTLDPQVGEINNSNLSFLENSDDRLGMTLNLAWVISMSLMTSLTSSVANSLVAQKSSEILCSRVTYFRYLAYGFPVSVIFSAIGVFIISITRCVY